MLAAALRYCREQTTPKRVVTLVPDNGNKYLSKVYNDYWVIEQGLSSRNLKGNLSDLIARTHDTGGTVTVGPDDTLMVAYNRMRAGDVSQLPVVMDGRIVGILDEHDILAHVEGHDEFRAQQFKDPVRSAMTARLKTVQVNDTMEVLPPIFERNEVAIVLRWRQIRRPHHPHRPHQSSETEQMTDGKNRLAFATRTIHAGQHPDPTTGAVMVPIYATSTYAQESPGVHKGYEYSRSQNPTRQAFERCIADLESGERRLCLRVSGLAAISTVLELLDTGDHVIASDDLYGGSFRLFDKVRKRSAGLTFDFVDMSDLANVEKAIKPNTKMIWVETPTNPLLRLADLAGIAKLAKKRGILTASDNTFASPYMQRPLEQGIDIVVHSTTKYLNGHSDIVGGCAVVGRQQGPGRASALPAQRRRRDSGAVRFLPRAARTENAGAAHGAALQQRAEDRALAGSARRMSSACSIRAWKAIRSMRWRKSRWPRSAAS